MSEQPKTPSRHVKIPGYVVSVEGTRWSAILQAPGGDLIADMRDPLPAGKGEGYVFTLHRTKKGRTYLFWPPVRHVSPSAHNRALRRAKAWAKDMMKAFDLPSENPPSDGTTDLMGGVW